MKYSLRVISVFNTVPYVIISFKKKEKNKVKGLKDLENMVSEKKKVLKRMRKNQNTGIKIIIFATEEGVK